MAAPKCKMPRSNTRNRRAQWKASVPALTPCPCPRRELVAPHHACPQCDEYKRRTVVEQP